MTQLNKTARLLLIGAEDVVGFVLLACAGAALVEAVLPSPESATAGTYGYVVFAVATVASILFFVAANNLHRTGRIAPRLHMAAAVCALLLPIMGAANLTLA